MASFPVAVTRSSVRPVLAMVVCYAVLGALGWIAGVESNPELASVFITFATIGPLALSFFVIKRGAGAAGSLLVSTEHVTLGKVSIPRRGMQVAVRTWKQAPMWTIAGTVLELVGRDRTLAIGGQQVQPPHSGFATATRVDGSMSAAAFMQLARALDLEATLTRGDTDTFEIDLAPSTTGIRGAYRGMAPWFGTMALAALVGVGGSLLGLERHPWGTHVMLGLTIAVIIGGLYVTVIRSQRPPIVRHRLVVRRGALQLEDVAAGNGMQSTRSTPASPASPATVERVSYRYVTKYGTYQFPALRLSWPNAPSRSIVVGVWDPQLLWTHPTEQARRMDYLVNAQQWRLLLQALELGSGPRVGP